MSHDDDEDEDVVVRDSNGNELKNGDSVSVIKDLPVKGSSIVIKRGTNIKNSRLTNNHEQIECNADKIKVLVLKT